MPASEDIVSNLGERAIRRGHVGLAIGVVSGDEEAVFGFGRAREDGPDAPSGSTIFEIGSITKVFTGVLLADMAAEGLLALDDPLQTLLPTGTDAPRRDEPVLLAELASHSAGLPVVPRGVIRAALRRPLHPFQALLDAYAAQNVDDVYRSLARTKARRRGARARYSNLGAGLLGNVLAARAGASYEAAVRERVCLPLGMQDTVVEVPEAARPRLAHGHTRGGRRQPDLRLPGLAGAGALRSTADDLPRVLRANIDPPLGRLGEAIELARRPRARIGRRIGVGLGWMTARCAAAGFRCTGTTAARAGSEASSRSSERQGSRSSSSETRTARSTASG